MKKEIMLEVRDLAIGFTSYDARLNKVLTQAIKKLSITVRRGEILAVVGASGSGKSLLAHAIMGILPQNSRVGGEIYYRGEKLTPERIDKLRGQEIAFVPQAVAFLDPLMRVGEQVAYAGAPLPLEAVADVFRHYGLDDSVMNLYPFELSGGMARRVLLATAHITKPDLIVADEPTPGLDLDLALKALSDFRSFADEQHGVLLITHDIDLAINIADSIAIFHEGEVIEVASTKEFSGTGAGLTHPYSRALFRALPQNDFILECCPHCGSSAAMWEIEAGEMRCGCGNH